MVSALNPLQVQGCFDLSRSNKRLHSVVHRPTTLVPLLLIFAIFDKSSGQIKSLISKKSSKHPGKEKEFVEINEADVEIEYDPSERISKASAEGSRYRNINGVDFTFSKRPYTAIQSERIQPYRRSTREPPRVLGPARERSGAPPQFVDITLSSAQIIYQAPVKPTKAEQEPPAPKSPQLGVQPQPPNTRIQPRPQGSAGPSPSPSSRPTPRSARPPIKPPPKAGQYVSVSASASASASPSGPAPGPGPGPGTRTTTPMETQHPYSRYSPYSKGPEFPIENQPYYEQRRIITDTLVSRSMPPRQPSSIITDTLQRSDHKHGDPQNSERRLSLEEEIAELFNTDVIVDKGDDHQQQQQPLKTTLPPRGREEFHSDTISRPDEDAELTDEGIRALRDGYRERRARAHRLRSKQQRELDEIFE